MMSGGWAGRIASFRTSLAGLAAVLTIAIKIIGLIVNVDVPDGLTEIGVLAAGAGLVAAKDA